MQIPKNKILENQYTNGTTLRFARSKVPYVGLYNTVSNKYFTGKTYNETSSKPLEKYNIIKTAASAIAAAGSVVSAVGSITQTRYFYKDLTSSDVLIKEIDKNAYNKLAGEPNMTYQVTSYNSKTQSLNELNKQMSGLTIFLET